MIAEERLRLELPALQLPSRKSLPPFESLRAFDAIARLGGIRRAAEFLCRDHGVVSRHLRTIEDWTGTKLVRRTTTGAVLTANGVRYHRLIANAMDMISNATVDLMGGGDDRRLCIRAMPGLALYWLASRLTQFAQTNGELQIEVRPIDATTGMPTEHGDVHLRLVPSYGLHAPSSSEYRSVDFAHSPIIAVASPGYLAAHTPIEKPADIVKHELLHEENHSDWYMWLAAHGVNSEIELSGLKLWQGHLTINAARHDGGIALTNHLTAASDLASGQLVEIGKGLSTFESRAMGIWRFISRADSWESTAVRHFRNWLIATVQSHHPQLAPARR